MRRLTMLVLATAAVGCGNDSPTAPAPPAAPRSANVALAASGSFRALGSESYTDGSRRQCGDLHVDWNFVESGGGPATITGTEVSVLHTNGDVTNRVVQTGLATRISALGSARLVTDRANLCGWVGRPTLRLTCEVHLCCPTQSGASCGNDFPLTVRGAFTVVDETGASRTLTASVAIP